MPSEALAGARQAPNVTKVFPGVKSCKVIKINMLGTSYVLFFAQVGGF